MPEKIRPTCLALLPLLLVGSSACGGKEDTAKATPTPATYAQNLLSSLDRTAVEKTRVDMNAIRTAMSSYSTDSGNAPDAADFAALLGMISPTYIRVAPQSDAWGHPFVFRSGADGWKLIAPGADGVAGTPDDIVLTDAGFTQLPAGYRPVM